MGMSKIIINIGVALALYFFTGVFLITISDFLSQNNLLLQRLADVIGWTVATWYLFTKYPLEEKIFSLEVDQIDTFVIYGVLGSLIVGILSYPYAFLHNEGSLFQDSIISPLSRPEAVGFFILIAVFISPILEELFTRGCLFRILKSKIGFLWAALLSSCFFVMLHHVFNHGQFMRIFIISIVLTIVYDATNTIKASVVAHITGNAVWYLAVYGRLYGFI